MLLEIFKIVSLLIITELKYNLLSYIITDNILSKIAINRAQ